MKLLLMSTYISGEISNAQEANACDYIFILY